jgi:outer membrane protein OmpA-like peptidoglycan-associated protein
MRRIGPALLLAGALGCAAAPITPPETAPAGGILRAAELARVRCLLLAPLENGTDAPLAADAATGARVSAVDGSRTKVFPVPELRALFRDTPLELPPGVPPSLALELAQLVGADAALWGSVEGRAAEGGSDLVITLRLSLAGDHQLLFADSAVVSLRPGERVEPAVRKAAVELARPLLARLGDAGKKRCFDADRTRALRKYALAEASAADAAAACVAGHAPEAAPPPAPAPAPRPAPAAAPAPQPRTPRQAEWARRLAGGDRVFVEELAFAGRSARLETDRGVADLAQALLAAPAVRVRVEGFVDTTSDRAADARLSAAMAQAVARRLVELGVPAQRVEASGRGSESPVLPNFTARGRAANRRVEVVAVP